MKYIIIALIIGYFVFAAIGIRMGHKPSAVVRMSFEGLRTAGVIFMTLARSGNVDPTIAAGVVLSDIYFGDRTSPASSTAFTVASVTGTDLYENVRGMLRTGLAAWLICFAIYAFLSWRNPLAAVDPAAIASFESNFVISGWNLIPAAVILVFPLLHIPILITLITSIAAASVITVSLQHMPVSALLKTLILGYSSPDPQLSAIINGGGMISMLGTVVIVGIACSYTGIMNGTGMIEHLRSVAGRLADKLGLFPCVILISFVCACIFCNQVVAIIMSNELMHSIYEEQGRTSFDLAMDIENSSITIPALVPWCILISVPLAIFGVTHAAAPYAVYIYAIPLEHLLAIHIAGKKRDINNR